MAAQTRRAAVAAVLAGGLLAGLAAPAWADASAGDAAFRATTLNLQAEGVERVAPDMATLSLGVQVAAPQAREAQAQAAERMGRVLAALRRAGFGGVDLRTSVIGLSPQYVYAEGAPPRLTGYRATQTVVLTVRDLSRLGPAIDAAAGAGADSVGGLTLGLADPTAAEDAARRAAVRKLQAEAALYAQAVGRRPGRLVNLTETGGYVPPSPIRPVMMLRAAAKVAETPVEAGEIEVKVQTTALFELAP